MRIVSLISSATEMIFALGLEAELLAVSHECDWPAAARGLPVATRSRVDSSRPSDAIDRAVKSLVASGEPLYELDEALLRRLRPDLIITQAQCDVCAIRLDDVLKLRETSEELKHSRVLPLNPISLDDVLADVERVSLAADVAERGKTLVAEYRARIAAIECVTSMVARRDRPRVLCIEWIEPLMPAGNWTPRLIEMAGGQSGLAIAGQHSAYSTWEQVAEYDPQVILVAPCGFDLSRTLQESRSLPQVAVWHSLTAVRNNRVFAVDGNGLLNRSGPRLIESLELLAQLIHPRRMTAAERLRHYWQPL